MASGFACPERVDFSGERDNTMLTYYELMTDAIEAYKAFDARQPGWTKVELATASGALAG
jgi:threonine dehydrogenase-like Zn-dependent dehydrogenase